MEKDIFCGKHLCEEAIIEDSKFINVGMGRVLLDNVDLSHAKLNNVNMSHMTIQYVQIGGTSFRHVGLPPDRRATEKQEPLTFQDCDFNRSSFTDCDLTGISLKSCKLEDATIDGVPVQKMIDAYRDANNHKEGTDA